MPDGRYFFALNERVDALHTAAAVWLGTPFREHGELRGAGVDCVHLAHALMVESGLALPEVDVADYPLDWAQHHDRSLLTAWLERQECFELLAADAPLQPGDVVCFRQGRCAHHIGVMADGRWFVHVHVGRRVERGMIDDPTYSRRLACAYRPLEVVP